MGVSWVRRESLWTVGLTVVQGRRKPGLLTQQVWSVVDRGREVGTAGLGYPTVVAGALSVVKFGVL